LCLILRLEFSLCLFIGVPSLLRAVVLVYFWLIHVDFFKWTMWGMSVHRWFLVRRLFLEILLVAIIVLFFNDFIILIVWLEKMRISRRSSWSVRVSGRSWSCGYRCCSRRLTSHAWTWSRWWNSSWFISRRRHLGRRFLSLMRHLLNIRYLFFNVRVCCESVIRIAEFYSIRVISLIILRSLSKWIIIVFLWWFFVWISEGVMKHVLSSCRFLLSWLRWSREVDVLLSCVTKVCHI